MVAALALVTYAIFLFALVKLIPITLTLPGIAGLILTLGVAADANIVIFERIKEEARAGRSIPAAITSGYGKALRTIIDANVVTIGVAFILFTLATAGVKGFAFTLGIGVLVLALHGGARHLGDPRLDRPTRGSSAPATRSALGARRPALPLRLHRCLEWFFSASGLIIRAGALAIATLGINFGIDFSSGTRIKTPLEQPATVDQVRQSLPESTATPRSRRSRSRSSATPSCRSLSRRCSPTSRQLFATHSTALSVSARRTTRRARSGRRSASRSRTRRSSRSSRRCS